MQGSRLFENLRPPTVVLRFTFSLAHSWTLAPFTPHTG